MSKITLKQAARWCGGFVEEKYADVEFFGANNDTRVLKPGQLFIALQGARDGHDFIPAAMEKGAAAVLCSRKMGDFPAIYVEDPRTALGKIAREVAAEVLGAENITSKGVREMGGDDLAEFFLEGIPGYYYLVGMRNSEKGVVAPHHSREFRVDEDVLDIGLELQLRMTLRYLGAM